MILSKKICLPYFEGDKRLYQKKQIKNQNKLFGKVEVYIGPIFVEVEGTK